MSVQFAAHDSYRSFLSIWLYYRRDFMILTINVFHGIFRSITKRLDSFGNELLSSLGQVSFLVSGPFKHTYSLLLMS